jgi:hypothetical protein
MAVITATAANPAINFVDSFMASLPKKARLLRPMYVHVSNRGPAAHCVTAQTEMQFSFQSIADGLLNSSFYLASFLRISLDNHFKKLRK